MRIGVVVTESWAGRMRWKCEIIARRGKRTQVRMLQRTPLPRRWVEAGAVTTVPTASVVDYGTDPLAHPAPDREGSDGR